ncbi:NTP transferase domain-containing protein [Pseudonocardia sp. H11422]|uniref:NTP transferase domain-containing protein n=1 Tax=Pseudonocardia sp. H11422 TaxID=2835866 RepID=UPI001BDD09F3|nr:NTP transferase domain-containing protein [Pseudonocardia sp. H11422]
MSIDGAAAGIVLAGGRSSRMGAPKAALEWHGSTLLRRTVALLSRTVDGPVVVVRAPGQDLPALPARVEVVEDPVEGLGPMQGIATGLAAVAGRAPIAFVCSTDLPFLHPAFVRRVLRGLADTDIGPAVDVVLPVARGFPQPLAAAYRTALAELVAELVADGRLRPAMLFQKCRVARPDDAELLADAGLARLDPELDSLVNVNAPEDYDAARRRPAPEITVQRYGALAGGGHHGPQLVRAGTLAAAADAAGLVLDRHVVAALNGDQISHDAELPLVAGDVVAFLSADAGG